MAWVDNGQGQWVSDMGADEATAPPASVPPSAGAQTPTVAAPAGPTDADKAAAAVRQANGQKAVWDPKTASYSYMDMSPSEKLEASLARGSTSSVAPPANPGLPSYADVLGAQAPADRSTNPYGTPPTVEDRLAGLGRTPGQAAPTSAVPIRAGSAALGTPQAGGSVYGDFATVAPPAAPGAQAPTVDRSAIDPLLKGLSSYQGQIAGLAGDQTGLSVAEAQLLKGDQLAKIRAANELQNSQAGALGAARSSRNRGDTALLERQAVGEQAYLGQESQRQDVLRQAELEGNQSILRATEADADRRFKLDALKTAGDLGLNTAALQTDISKADLGSANNWINNEFQQQGLNKQLDQQQTEGLLNFTRDMAAIEEQYAGLDQASQQFIVDSELKKYGIDQGTYVALKTAADGRKLNWGQLLTTFVGGAVSGAAAVGTKAALA